MPRFSNLLECIRMKFANRYKPTKDIAEYPLLNEARSVAQPNANSTKKKAHNTDKYNLGEAVSINEFKMGDIAYNTRYDVTNQYGLPK